MNLIHDDIKIDMWRQGFLPDYPYHLISEEEMLNAFINADLSFFQYYYACPTNELQSEYDTLVEEIRYHVQQYIDTKDNSSPYEIPTWVYSYMMRSAISETSSVADKHDMFVLMNLDNIDDTYTPEIAKSCYEISKKWISRLPASQRAHRPPTMFGEPHVIKSLRLSSMNLDVENNYSDG